MTIPMSKLKGKRCLNITISNFRIFGFMKNEFVTCVYSSRIDSCVVSTNNGTNSLQN